MDERQRSSVAGGDLRLLNAPTISDYAAQGFWLFLWKRWMRNSHQFFC